MGYCLEFGELEYLFGPYCSGRNRVETGSRRGSQDRKQSGNRGGVNSVQGSGSGWSARPAHRPYLKTPTHNTDLALAARLPDVTKALLDEEQ